MTIDPPEGAFPVALHGAVADFADEVEIIGVNGVDGEYCLHLDFLYESSILEELADILLSADIRCR